MSYLVMLKNLLKFLDLDPYAGDLYNSAISCLSKDASLIKISMKTGAVVFRQSCLETGKHRVKHNLLGGNNNNCCILAGRVWRN